MNAHHLNDWLTDFSALVFRRWENRTDSDTLMRIVGVFPPLINMMEKKNEKNALLCFPAYCLSFGRQRKCQREQIYSEAHRWNNAAMKAESQFGTQCWLADKFRSFQACVGNSCVHIKRVSLVNFLRFAVREEFVYVRLCGWLLRLLDTAWAKGIRAALKNWNVKRSVISCQGGSVGTRFYRYAANGLSHLGAQIMDLLFPFSYYWSLYYLVRKLSPRRLGSISSAKHPAPKAA